MEEMAGTVEMVGMPSALVVNVKHIALKNS
jgi:hypothetical protein